MARFVLRSAPTMADRRPLQDLRTAVLLPLLLASAGTGHAPAGTACPHELFAQLLAGGSGTDALEALCRRHPEHAPDFRRWWRLARGRTGGREGRGDFSGDPPHGTLVGPYRLTGELGRGGMGAVYLGEQSWPVQRRVAVKIATTGDERVLRQFEVERQSLAETNHDNVVRLYEAGVTPRGEPWFAMEHVPGQPLTVYCDERGLDVDARLALFDQACAGVQHLHEHGILHRDLKPANILVTEQAGRPVVKVIDLGLALRCADRHGEPDADRGDVVGTPGYTSPEQARGEHQSLDARTDVYALGALLYELLAGATPIAPERLCEGGLHRLHRTLHDTAPPSPLRRLRQLGPGAASVARLRSTSRSGLARRLRGPAAAAARRAVARDRDQRPNSVRALAELARGDGQRETRHWAGSVTAAFRAALARLGRRLGLAGAPA